MVPIRDVVIFPFTKVAFKIGRPSSVKRFGRSDDLAIKIFFSPRNTMPPIDEPRPEQIFTVGTIGRILQAQKQENGQVKVVVEGRERGQCRPC